MREVALQQLDFRALGSGQFGSFSRLEVHNGFAPLLDHLVDDRDDGGIVEHDALVHLALLDSGEKQANGRQTRRIPGAHCRFHVLSDASLEVHR